MLKQQQQIIKTYLVGKMFQRRTFLWFSVELLHTALPEKHRFLLNLFCSALALISASMSSTFAFMFNHFPFYTAERPSFFHYEVFHSIKTYFTVFFFSPYCITLFNRFLFISGLSWTEVSTQFES